MRKYILLIVALLLAMPQYAQTRHRSGSRHQRTTTTYQKKGGKQRGTQTTAPAQKGGKGKASYTTSEIRGLQSQRKQIEQDIRAQQNRLQVNKADVQNHLSNLLVINGEIDAKQKDIDGFEQEIRKLDGNIGMLQSQMSTLQSQLKERQEKFKKSVQYMAQHRKVQDKLMFIFSAKSLTQAYRRLRFVQDYAAYQRAQGEQIKAKQEEIRQKDLQLKKARSQKDQLLSKGKAAKAELQSKHYEQQQVVAQLQNEQKTIQVIIADQERKNAQINAEIDRLIAVEVEKARARAAAEAARKAEAAAAKKRAEEAARRKAAAEAAKREEERRIAAAKAEEARAKAAAEEARKKAAEEAARREEARRVAAAKAEEARQRAAAEAKAKEKRKAEEAARKAEAEARAAEEAARRSAEAQARTEQAAREAESARLAAERKAEADAARRKAEEAAAAREEERMETMSAVDRQISGSFESNRGRLPMPVTGKYKIVSHYGQYDVEGLKNVRLDNKGINILCESGASARSIFDGEVSAVVQVAGQIVVMVRHGDYISVYCNLRNVHVRKGQRVATRQSLGTVGQDNILQFQLRKERDKLNPESWLGR